MATPKSSALPLPLKRITHFWLPLELYLTVAKSWAEFSPSDVPVTNTQLLLSTAKAVATSSPLTGPA